MDIHTVFLLYLMRKIVFQSPPCEETQPKDPAPKPGRIRMDHAVDKTTNV
jgi:hypothetical protein